MSYSNPITLTHSITAITLQAATATFAFRGPKGLQGRIRDVIMRCTTTVVIGATVRGILNIGNATTANLYGVAACPALTAPSAAAQSDLNSGSVLSTTVIDADTVVLCATVAATGASNAGVVTYDILVDWF